jgi:hypothetical protein
VSREFIVKGIRAGKLEYREDVIWGNPYLKLLRGQLEQFIANELGKDYPSKGRNETELRKIKKEISSLNKRLNELQSRKAVIEKTMRK